MKASIINRKIISYLQSISDKETFYIRENKGHPVCIGKYGGIKRCFSLSASPNSNYPNYMKPRVNHFVRSLIINPQEKFHY